MTARELAGDDVANALAAEITRATPERASLILVAIADRNETAIPSAVLEVAKSGPKQVRVAAISVVGRLGNESSLPVLLEIASEGDAEVALAAKTALAGLSGKKVDAEIAARLSKTEDKSLAVLIELAGQRRVEATPALVKALDHSNAAVRGAAVTALGETVGPKDLSVLISQVTTPKNSIDATVALKALRAASVRMPDREACAAELAKAMEGTPVETQAKLLEILGAVGGSKALSTIAAAVSGSNEQLQDAGSRLLGEWMNADAAPVLLDLAKNPSSDKYKVRLLRGYIRIARQFQMPDDQRAEMCDKALAAASRPEEQKLVLAVLERYPS
ncbi:MAG TPA: HEAT repeat domain-containing protein, partial [Burkholderiaceae bacterium]|nr:HEAT repeat domain-containing protein [Burkholderiaceae bacterium]